MAISFFFPLFCLYCPDHPLLTIPCKSIHSKQLFPSLCPPNVLADSFQNSLHLMRIHPSHSHSIENAAGRHQIDLELEAAGWQKENGQNGSFHSFIQFVPFHFFHSSSSSSSSFIKFLRTNSFSNYFLTFDQNWQCNLYLFTPFSSLSSIFLSLSSLALNINIL